MFRQIMVPLDGSILAERALPPAVHLAALTGATVHLVRAVEPPPAPARMHTPINVYDRYMAEEIRAAATYLEAVRTQLGTDGLRVQVRPLRGGPRYALPHYEHRAGIDLMVMSSHGRAGLARVALGSVADHLLRHGKAPVLLVRAFGDPTALDHAVVPLDGSTRAEETLRFVAHLAGSVIHEVTLLRVIDAPTHGPEAERYLEQVAESLPAERVACSYRVEQGDPAEQIIAAAGRDKLVVMTTRGHGALLRWALGSVADRVARHGATAVLVVRAEAAPEPTTARRSMTRSGIRPDAEMQQDVLREQARDGRM